MSVSGRMAEFAKQKTEKKRTIDRENSVLQGHGYTKKYMTCLKGSKTLDAIIAECCGEGLS